MAKLQLFEGLHTRRRRRAGQCWQLQRHLIVTAIHMLLLLVVAIQIPACSGHQQKFRTTPQDFQVLERSEALLRCEVSNLAGQVQWTKDGFALGFSAVIPGFPRYSVLGDRAQGVYNLKITNASLEDDAEYQCQVGPAKLNSAIRANAKLTVISPPASIEIEGRAHNSKVEVTESQDLTLTCIVADAKPAAQIQWFRKNLEYKPDNREETTVEAHGKRFTTTSRLRLTPTAEDDYTDFSCQAKHKALQPDMPMRVTVQLSVLYPPGAPYIEGFTHGETLRRGQAVELACRSRGGNPPAQLIWYKNGAQVRMAYRTNARMSENIYTFTAEAGDNKARFRCEASNIMSPAPLKAEVDLIVMFAPAHVSITGPSEARENEQIPLQCSTDPSNPPAEIRWMVNGRRIQNTTSRTVVSPDGGWITTSNLTASVEPNKRSMVVICHGINMQLTENTISTHTVNVLYPPSQPIITGYVEGSIIPAGTLSKLLCVSTGGNPLATLTWFKNDKKINSVLKTGDKMVSAELAIMANVTDNQARYRCEAQNSATEIPLFESKTLSVHFAAENVKIRIEPDELLPGTEAVLTCDSSSSNPPAKLSWWMDGIPVEGSNESAQAGLWGGTVASLDLRVNVTQDMDGIVYTCQSFNEALTRSVHEAIALRVLYPPKFVPAPSSTVVGVEGEPLQVPLIANANPASIAYTWTKDGQPLTAQADRIVSEGPVLNITRLVRSDAGIYACQAANSQGTATINITVVVEYGAAIVSISENMLVSPGEEAVLACTVDGKPLTEDHVRWERAGYEMGDKTTTTFANGTSYLHISNAQRPDVGDFRCVADNRVANPTSRDVLLIVKFAPEIDQSKLRSASGAGERARLPCRALASPQPQFTWTRNGQQLNVNKTRKYGAEKVRAINGLAYESILIIDNVAAADYGQYECQAANELGQTKAFVRLDITSKPEPPMALVVLNATHENATLEWTPGFDGGEKANYRVRFREAKSEHYHYEDGVPGVQRLTVTGLRANTMYLFSVRASNSLGNSEYLPDLTKATTEAPTAATTRPQGGGQLGPVTTSTTPTGGHFEMRMLVTVVAGIGGVLLNILFVWYCLHRCKQSRIKRGVSPQSKAPSAAEEPPADGSTAMDFAGIAIIALVAFALLVMNVVLVAWYLIRKRNKELSNQNSKSATIEMYAPSSYNDTVTGETLSSVSEKSDSYSNEESQPDYMDDTRKKSTSTYLVENSDIPPPLYQKDGTLPVHFPMSGAPVNAGHMKTLPHPRHNIHIMDARARDDQMIGKGYMPSPSPAPPMDGSYYNMNSDRYLSYPPMDYPSIDFSTPPLQMQHPGGPAAAAAAAAAAAMGNGPNSGTLRRGVRGLVPPPDVTHHTTHGHQLVAAGGQPLGSGMLAGHLPPGMMIAGGGGVGGGGGGGMLMMNAAHQHQQHQMQQQQLQHMHAHAHPAAAMPPTAAAAGNNPTGLNNLSGVPPKPQPPGILKDPNRKAPQHSNIQILNVANVQGLQQQQQQSAPSPSGGGSIGGGGGGGGGLQNNSGSSNGNGGLLATAAAFDPSSHNLSSFNASMGYTDADGHLV